MNQAILEAAAGGAAVIISSHLLALVERLCSKVLVLHHGQALLSGALGEIRTRFPELAGDASLEEVFFRATESAEGTSPLDAAARDPAGKSP
jgi:ABC-2 type transport system ATP-binding protein